MSEKEGLAKLAAYLQQTRKQAEESIDVLNTRIMVLESEAEAISSERDHFKNYSEQLKLENSKKWRLQERDDWKSLVESIQTDRTRLRQDCSRLESELEEAKAGVKILEEEISHMTNSNSQLSYDDSTLDFGRSESKELEAPLSPSGFFASNNSFQTPTKGSNTAPGNEEIRKAPTPRAVSLKLQVELQRALAKSEAERKSFEEDKKAQEKKISDLEMELSRFKKTGNGSKINNSNQIKNMNSEQLKLDDSGVGVYNVSRNSVFMYSVPQSFFSFLFSSGPVMHAPVLNV